MRATDLIPNIKEWSNFRLMLVIGSLITMLSLVLGGAYVQAALSDQGQGEEAVDLQDDDEPDGTAEDDPPAPPALSQGSSAVTEVPLPGPEAGQDFTVFCPTGDGTATENTCRVRSHNDFSAPVRLSCDATPPGVACTFSPRTVTPPPNGRVTFDLSIALTANVESGGHVFNVTGRSGDLINSYRYPFVVAAPPLVLPPGERPPPPPPEAEEAPAPPAELEPTFTIVCSLNPGPETVIDKLLWSVSSGPEGKIKCIVKPVNGFTEEVRMDLANISGEVTSYEFDPPIVVPTPASPNPDEPTVEGSSFVDLTVGLGNLEDGAEYSFDVTGTSDSVTRTRRVVLTVTDRS